MLILRKIGGVLLGKATPFQIFAACLLGSWLGFIPGFMQAPGLVITLCFLLAILNANLWLAGIAGVLAKLLSLALISISVAIGQVLLGGPAEGLFAAMINAPVLALFGFEYYSITGGLVLGTLFGLAGGFLIVGTMTRLRRKFLSLDENSERFQFWMNKGWVKFLTWVMLGAKPNRAQFEKLAATKIGNPVRISGAVLVVLSLVLGWALNEFLSARILTAMLVEGLEQANGATVDLAKAEVQLSEGKITIEGLALADRHDLAKNCFSAARLEADVSGKDLLRRRLHLESVLIAAAESGSARKIPGQRLHKPPAEKPTPSPDPAAKPLEDYIKDAQVWYDRLAQAADWLERLQGTPGEETAGAPADKEREKNTREKNIEQEIRANGLARAKAAYLIEGSPTFLISKFEITRLTAHALGGKTLSVKGENLSTHPCFVEGSPRIVVTAEDASLVIDVTAGASAAKPSDNRLQFMLAGISVDEASEQLKVSGSRPVQGGTMQIGLQGTWKNDREIVLDAVTTLGFQGTSFLLPGSDRMEKIEKLSLPLKVSGPLAHPSVSFSQQQLIDGLVAAGRAELANRVRGELDKQVDKATGELEKKAADKLGKELDKAVGEETKKELEKKTKGLLDGVLGGDKKKK